MYINSEEIGGYATYKLNVNRTKFKIQTKQNFKQNKIHMQLYFKSKNSI